MSRSTRPLILDQHEAFLQSQQRHSDRHSPFTNGESSDEDEAPGPSTKPFFPPAIVIRSDPIPQNLQIEEYDPNQSPFTTLSRPPPKSTEWAEWNINPAKHGPERYKGPPTFVPSKGDYDELGRSTIHGSSVSINLGETGKDKEGKENGETLAGWYASLSRSGSGTNTPKVKEDVGLSHLRMAETVKVSKDQAIDLTADSDEEEEGIVQPQNRSLTNPNISIAATQTSNQPAGPSRPRDWFSRRTMSGSRDAETSGKRTTSSIGSMLGTSIIEPKNIKALPTYVLGPENKGYEILRDRLGWGGGGLGKPLEVGARPLTQTDGDSSSALVGGSSTASTSTARNLEETENVGIKSENKAETLGDDINAAIDLTIDSEDDPSSDFSNSDLDSTPPPELPSGPGRTAPISTSLKLDKLGLGHKRALKDHQGNTLKRVTHTHEQIVLAQKRAKYRRPVEALELGKKGKIKWKEKDKREREERRRLAAALNA